MKKLCKSYCVFSFVLLSGFIIIAAVGCKSQPAASTGGASAGEFAGDGTIVITGDPAGKLLDLDFEDPSQPLPFKITKDSNPDSCYIGYQDGKLLVTSRVTTQRPWMVTTPLLDKEIRDFFWQFDYTPNSNHWDSVQIVFRSVGGSHTSAYHIHIHGTAALGFANSTTNLAKNNDNIQVHSVYGMEMVNGVLMERKRNIDSARLDWWTPGRTAVFRIVAEGDKCRIWIWRKGQQMPAKPMFDFIMDIPELSTGDFMFVLWEGNFMLDNMVIFDRAIP